MEATELGITFIGTGNYEKTVYEFQEQQLETQLFSLAFCKFVKPKVLNIFMTNESKDKWYKYLIDNLPDDIEFKETIIPIGKTETELWDVFSIILESLKGYKSVSIDITHAFRSLPIFAVAAAAYIQELKGVSINNLLYGAFEARVEEVTPVFDLSPMIHLFRWMTMVHDVINWGRGFQLANELHEKHNQLRHQNLEIRHLKNIAPALNKYSDMLLLNRTAEIKPNIENLVKKISLANDELGDFPPLQILLNDLSDQISQTFCLSDEFEAQKSLLIWYFNHNHHYQAVSLLRELIITQVCRSNLKTPENPDDRKFVEDAINNCAFSCPDITKFINYKDFWNLVRDLRNDLMHAQAGRKSDVNVKPNIQYLIKDNYYLLLLSKFGEVTLD